MWQKSKKKTKKKQNKKISGGLLTNVERLMQQLFHLRLLDMRCIYNQNHLISKMNIVISTA